MLAPMDGPSDELRPRFARLEDEDKTKNSFVPDRAEPERSHGVDQPRAGPVGGKSNDELRAEIQAIMPQNAEGPRKEIGQLGLDQDRKPEDLNGLRPSLLLLGGGTYAVTAFLGYQFTIAAASYFNNNPLDDDMFYVVARFSGFARSVVVAMGALGTSVTTIASAGQLALAVRVAIGIATGELDPTAEREDLYAAKKQTKLAQMLLYMTGNKDMLDS
jgi:hypothetical protein